ncbi:MAG: C_GCAxxG_C_C family protein, partial [Clostridia bacterium]|nr:C_GCAxxG_C_C family protein [Clostridia bacterium]
ADEAKSMAPRPRDEGGKCGAYLAGKKVLSSLNPSAVEEFEKRFVELNGSCECAVLRARRAELKKTCDDFVGDAARLVEEVLK